MKSVDGGGRSEDDRARSMWGWPRISRRAIAAAVIGGLAIGAAAALAVLVSSSHSETSPSARHERRGGVTDPRTRSSATRPGVDDSLNPRSRIYTLAGGGSHSPKDGLPATLAKLVPTSLAALPDGTVVVVHDDSRAFAIAADARLRALPRLGDRGVSALAAQRDGSLLAVSGGGEIVYRLRPGAGEWEPFFDVKRLTGGAFLQRAPSIAASPDGSFVLGVSTDRDTGVWRVQQDGTFREVPQPKAFGPAGDTVAALSDGSVAFTYGGSDRLVIVGTDGSQRRIRGRWGIDEDLGLAELPGGNLLRAETTLDQLTPGGAAKRLAGERPGLGLGDGGPVSSALLDATDVVVAADGAIIIADRAPSGSALDLPATRRRGGPLVTRPWLSEEVRLLRVVLPINSVRPVVAITRSTYRTLPRGRVGYRTTVAGDVTVVVRHRGKTVARVSTTATVGEGALWLVQRPPSGDLRLSLQFTGSNGSVIVHRLAVTALHTLGLARARRVMRREALSEGEGDTGGGREVELGRCRRVSDRRVDCQQIVVEVEEGRTLTRSCAGLFSARLRPDGVRVVAGGNRRACRQFGRA